MNFELLHPNRPSTWKNSPAPPIDQRYIDELTRIGGLNERGEPMLRFAWGQTRTQFRCDREHLLYIDERIPEIRHVRHLLKRVLFYDADNVPQWETEYIKECPRVIPEGWLYEEQLESVEFIGIQTWYIEQYKAPEIRLPSGRIHREFGTPEEWEKIRYDAWDDPITGFNPYCDRLGPFPREGRYVSFMQISRPFSYLVEEDEPIHESYIDETGMPALRQIGEKKVKRLIQDVCYRPIDEDFILAVRAGRHARDHRRVESPEEHSKRMFYEQSEKEARLRKERVTRAREYLKQDHWRWSSPDSGPTGGLGGGARIYGGIGENHVNTNGKESVQ